MATCQTQSIDQSAEPDRSPFFIVGTGRCGSSMFQAMLRQHPDIRIPLETHYFLHLDPAIYGFASLANKRDIETYIERVRQNSAHAGPGTDSELIDDLLERVRAGDAHPRELFLWLLHRTTESQSGRLVGEKTPAHWMKFDRIVSLFPDAKFIHIHRDPRAVTESLLRMDWWNNKSISWTAKYCKRTLKACAVWEQRLGHDRFLEIEYQDLIEDAQSQLEKACVFLGTEFDPCMLDPDQYPAELKHFCMLDPKRKGMYRECFSDAQIATIETVVGKKLMKSYGYSRESSNGELVKCIPSLTLDRAQNRVHKYRNEIRKIIPSSER
jgi:hypothetical protein